MNAAILVTGIPAFITPNHGYEITLPDNSRNFVVSTDCGDLSQDINSLILFSGSTMDNIGQGNGLCSITLADTKYVVIVETQSDFWIAGDLGISAYPFLFIDLITGANNTKIPLAKASALVKNPIYYPQMVYFSQPPLPPGLDFKGSKIVGSILDPTPTVDYHISLVNVFSGLKQDLVTIQLTVSNPPPSPSSISSGSISAAVIGSVLGFAILILAVVLYLQRKKKFTPFNFDSLLHDSALGVDGIRHIPQEIKRDCISIIEVLGKGNFGEVSKGVVNEPNGHQHQGSAP